MLKKALARLGHRDCGTAAAGNEVIASVRKDRPHAVLMDIGLSGNMDGIEAAHQIRIFSPVPITFTTGYPESDLKSRAREIPSSAYLPKKSRCRRHGAALLEIRFE